MYRAHEAYTRPTWRLTCAANCSSIIISDSQFRDLRPCDIKGEAAASIHRGLSMGDLALLLVERTTSRKVGNERPKYMKAIENSRTKQYSCFHCGENCLEGTHVIIQAGSNGNIIP